MDPIPELTTSPNTPQTPNALITSPTTPQIPTVPIETPEAAAATTPQGPTEGATIKKKTKTTSIVWEKHFIRINSEEARCNYCKKDFAANTTKNGTSSLMGHADRCPDNPNRKQVRGQQNLISFPPTRPGESAKLFGSIYDYDKVRKGLVVFIIRDEMSFKMVEGEGFRALCQLMEPRFKVPGRMTIYRDLLVIYKEEKENLKKYFKASKQRVSLTTDTWTSPNNFNYMCVTVHFIDQDWNLQKRILMFCQIKGHTGEAIGKMLEKCLMDWGLEDVFGVTLDNASANTKAVDYLKASVIGWTGATVRANYLQVRCAAHVLALVVKDGVLLYNKSIGRIRSVVKYVISSPARLARFRKCAALEKIPCKRGLILDVKTRWNSTYLMLDGAEKFERAFKRLEREDKGFKAKYIFPEDDFPNAFTVAVDASINDYIPSSSSESDREVVVTNPRGRNNKKKNNKKKPSHHAPYPQDWSYARGLVKCLKIFFDATIKFSASTEVTTHAFMWQLTLIHEQLVRFKNTTGDPFVSKMADVMFLKYNSYWGEYEDMNAALFFARLLDPREKEGGLKFDLECLYDQDRSRVAAVLRGVKQDLCNLYEEYRAMHSDPDDSIASTSTVGNVDEAEVVMQEASIEDMLELRKKKQRTNSHSDEPKSEVDRYFKDDVEASTKDFDILAWWKANANKYKILSLMAKDILAIPVSSVASESAFSTGKRVLTPWRSSLSPRTVEALICTQSWLQKPIALDFLCDYVPDDNSSIEEEILGPLPEIVEN